MAQLRKSRTTGELIPVVIFEFNGMADLWFSKDQYLREGGYKEIIKNMCLSIADIRKVHKLLANPFDFPTEEWQG